MCLTTSDVMGQKPQRRLSIFSRTLKGLLVFIKQCSYAYKNHFRVLIQISHILIKNVKLRNVKLRNVKLRNVKCLPDYLPNLKLCFLNDFSCVYI